MKGHSFIVEYCVFCGILRLLIYFKLNYLQKNKDIYGLVAIYTFLITMQKIRFFIFLWLDGRTICRKHISFLLPNNYHNLLTLNSIHLLSNSSRDQKPIGLVWVLCSVYQKVQITASVCWAFIWRLRAKNTYWTEVPIFLLIVSEKPLFLCLTGQRETLQFHLYQRACSP